MNIAVGTRSRASGSEPSRVFLGRCSLPVSAVLSCHDEGEARVFTVRVLDGRRFALRLCADHRWELIAAYGRTAAPPATRRNPLLPLLALLGVALARRAVRLASRACRGSGHHASDLPGGGAPA